MECPQIQMFDNYDSWRYDTASDVIPTTANESEQASPTGCRVLLKLKLGSHKHATKVGYWEKTLFFF